MCRTYTELRITHQEKLKVYRVLEIFIRAVLQSKSRVFVILSIDFVEICGVLIENCVKLEK